MSARSAQHRQNVGNVGTKSSRCRHNVAPEGLDGCVINRDRIMDKDTWWIMDRWLDYILSNLFLDPSPADPLSITYPYPLWIHYPLCIRLSIHYPSCILIHYPVSITHPSRSSGATFWWFCGDIADILAILCRHCRHVGDFVPTLWIIVCLLFVYGLLRN